MLVYIYCLRKHVFFCSKCSVLSKGAKTTFPVTTAHNSSEGNSKALTPRLHVIYRSYHVSVTESGKNSFQSLESTASFFRSWPKTQLPWAKYHLTANAVWQHPGHEQRTSEGRWRPLAVHGGRIDKRNPSLRQWKRKYRVDARFQK